MLKFFESQFGYTFNDPKILITAFTHRSYYAENRATSPGHFERLEFLGDSVLDLIVSETLMKAFPQINEGTLSKWRASLVNETTLSEIARELDLGKEILLGKSEERERGNLRPRLLASVLEAVVAAVYLDGGLGVCRRFVDRFMSKRIENLDFEIEFAADFKSRFQEITQKRMHAVPEYRLISAEGPEHAKTFTIEVFVNDRRLGIGQGASRKGAEQEAARDALSKELEL